MKYLKSSLLKCAQVCDSRSRPPPNTTIFFKDASVSGGTKQSDLLNGETAHFLEELRRPSANNCQSTEQSRVQVWPGTMTTALPLEEPSLLVEKGPWASKLFPVSARFFPPLKLGSLPQVQHLLWSTKLPNVLISAANAAGGQEDRVPLSEGTQAAQSDL